MFAAIFGNGNVFSDFLEAKDDDEDANDEDRTPSTVGSTRMLRIEHGEDGDGGDADDEDSGKIHSGERRPSAPTQIFSIEQPKMEMLPPGSTDDGKFAIIVGSDRVVLDNVLTTNMDGWSPLHSCCHR